MNNNDKSDKTITDVRAGGGVSETPPSSYSDYQVCIDYLKVRFDGEFNPERASFKHLEKLIEAFGGDIKKVFPKKGVGGYDRMYKYDEELVVLAGGNLTKNSFGEETYVIEMKGQACRNFEIKVQGSHFGESDEVIGKAVHDAWLHLFHTIAEYRGKCTRLDIPTDDFSGKIPLEELKEKFEKGEFSTKLRKNRKAKPTKSIEQQEEEGDPTGTIYEGKDGRWSVTLGGRTNSQLCVYNKLAERLGKGMGSLNVNYWVRYEVRYYHDSAVNALAMLTTAYESPDKRAVPEAIVGCLAGMIDLKEKVLSESNKNKMKTWSKWAAFIGAAQKINILGKQRIESTVESNARWLYEDASKCLARLIAIMPDYGFDMYMYLIAEAVSRFDMDDYFKINNYLISRGKKTYEDLPEVLAQILDCIGGKAPEVPEDIKELFTHDVFKLGSVKYIDNEDDNESEE